MRYGSVCSGIEAASLAWEPLGWSAAWFSEIEPFPSAVLAYHWPAVANLGDMTKIAALVRTGRVEAPDVLVGGTPCQAFSVAGLRNGLADARGQLTLSYVELADAIDGSRRNRGEKEAIIVWENVPGVLSSKDNAFGCFLAALAGEDEPLIPSGEKWTHVGYVSGPQRTIAWRVLDAQYFGVAQRRRRVFVVASARNDIDPAEILFEFDGLRRDITPSRETGKAVAALTANGVGTCGVDDNQAQAGHLVAGQGFRMAAFGQYADDETASTCKARDYKDATDLAVVFNWQAGGNTSATLGANEHLAGALQASQHPAIAFSSKDDGGDAVANLSPTIRAGNSDKSRANGGQPPAVAYSIAGNVIGRKAENGGNGTGFCQEIGYTLTKSDQHGVAQGMKVRRLTPRECERLQGMPDDHTLIPHGKTVSPEKMTGDYAKYLMRGGRVMTFEDCCRAAADSPRYKAIGNSMAVPCMHWIGERIASVLPAKTYDVIYADPPWQYGSKPNRGVLLEYPTMPLADLCGMRVREIASPNSSLFMWVTGAMMAEALAIGSAWGFKFIRVDKVWKKTKHTGSRHGVVGPWGMNDAEFLLLFTRGKVCSDQTERNQYTVYEEPYTGTHSGKPHFFREQIERRFSGARRIELFARTASVGWDVWGDQAPKSAALHLLASEGQSCS
ncbi:MT-A70 family methyltransferase [Yersinia ruckeri]|uniref:MT-A70 family methyltransferase n=5 Tax=Yersinia ruckeri TaxID=29486 RepID=UPI001F2A9A39|nr:MT-A70 family methyltransferase [Yersinia ruckeri]UIN18745.1 DNA (cytosine-5-)-methyltransferase [Yersinia ruckeri]